MFHGCRPPICYAHSINLGVLLSEVMVLSIGFASIAGRHAAETARSSAWLCSLGHYPVPFSETFMFLYIGHFLGWFTWQRQYKNS